MILVGCLREEDGGGESSILNSKSEFNRSYIPRLVVDKKREEEMELRPLSK